MSDGTLQIDGSAMPANVISGFAPGDTIDLSNVNYDAVNGCVALSVVQTNVLTIYENGSSYNLTWIRRSHSRTSNSNCPPTPAAKVPIYR